MTGMVSVRELVHRSATVHRTAVGHSWIDDVVVSFLAVLASAPLVALAGKAAVEAGCTAVAALE